MKRFIAILVALVAMPSSLCLSQANRLTMSGLVTDKASSRPVEGAKVTLIGNKAKADATTDSEGAFILELAEGVGGGSTVRIRVEKKGYKIYERQLAVSSEVPLRIPLESDKRGPSARGVCAVTATTKSELVARILMRGPLPKPPQTDALFEPVVQELFFDWSLSLNPKAAGDVYVILTDPKRPTYRLRVRPTNAEVSDAVPSWMSGFSEPREPDYYKRTVIFRRLDSSAVITARRPVKFTMGNNTLDASIFPVSSFEVLADSNCKVQLPVPEDEEKRFLQLMIQFRTFATWKHGVAKKELKTQLDPDEPMPPLQTGEVEGTVEMRCQDSDCTKVSVSQLEVRANRDSKVP